jgi:SUN domain-containing protein 1/2
MSTRRRRESASASAPARADDDNDDEADGVARAREASSASRGRQARRGAATPLVTVETSDDDDDVDDDDDDDGMNLRARIYGRQSIPFIVATACVTATALVAVVLQSISLRLNAFAVASARVSQTHADLAPMTRRLRDVEHAMKKCEERDAGRASAMLELRHEMDKCAKGMSPLEAAVDALKASQRDVVKMVQVDELKKQIAALATKAQKSNNANSGLLKKASSKVSETDFKALEAAVDALRGAQDKYVTSDALSTLTAVDVATEKQLKTLNDELATATAQLKALKTSSAKDLAAFSSATSSDAKDMLAQISALSGSVDTLSKSQNDFARMSHIDELKRQIDALSTSLQTKKSGGFFKKNPAQTAQVSNAQITALQNTIDALKKNQAGFAKSGDLKKLEARIAATAAPQSADFTSLEKHMTERVDQYMKSLPRTTPKSIFSKSADVSSNLWYADRTGRPDYALASGGGRVVAHSPISPFVARGDGPITAALTYLRSGVHPRSDDWLLTPSLEQPGDCLALHSPTGFIDVRLRQPITIDAVTLEHSDSLVAYDTHSAPKDFGIFGWLSNTKKSKAPKSMMPLGNFSYSVDLGAVQTFDVEAPRVVDHVRLFVKNNHGHKGWTCVYRFRVHGSPV